MKRLSSLLLLALSATLLTARTPNPNAVTYGETGIGEIKYILGQLGYEFYKLRLPVDAWQAYNVQAIVDEYENGELKKSDTFRFQPTIRRVIYDGETEVHNFIYDEISVIFNAGGLRGKNNVSFVIPGIMSMIHPLEISDRYVAYSSRPFEEQEFVPGRKTPVVLLGAFWYDERFGVNRFCGSDEVDAEMENELFELSPHYFVVSLRLDETGSEITDYNRKE